MSELPDNPISATVDFAREGVQHGFLKLPYSRDDSAWGAVMGDRSGPLQRSDEFGKDDLDGRLRYGVVWIK